MIDLTDLPDATVGDEVVFFGSQESAKIPITRIADSLQTIPYEILARIPQRVRRVYIKN
jgi:alanine racemase